MVAKRTRPRRVTIRVSEEEREMLSRMAEREGVTASTWLRSRVRIDWAKRPALPVKS